jgi:hypothetical protein
MGNCRGLKSIYRSDARKRQRDSDKDGETTIGTIRGLMRRIRPKKNVTRTLVTPTRIPTEASVASLVGRLP